MKGHRFSHRLKHAGAGLCEVWRRERSFRTQVILAGTAVAGTAAINPEPIWWAALALVIALVFVAELVNSSIESLADRLCPSEDRLIKAAKDMAAGAVLIASLAALAVGACLVLSAL
jgi:diacylglycerol kinase (ATP)